MNRSPDRGRSVSVEVGMLDDIETEEHDGDLVP